MATVNTSNYNLSDSQSDILAILLSEGFDYNISYEAVCFYPKDVQNARNFASSRLFENSNLNIPKLTDSNRSMKIMATCDSLDDFEMEIDKPNETNLQDLINKMEDKMATNSCKNKNMRIRAKNYKLCKTYPRVFTRTFPTRSIHRKGRRNTHVFFTRNMCPK